MRQFRHIGTLEDAMKSSSNVLAITLWLIIFLSNVGSTGSFRLVCDNVGQSGGKNSSSSFIIGMSSGGQSFGGGTIASSTFQIRPGIINTATVIAGDANADGRINVGDAVFLINYIFKSGPAPSPLEAGDANCDFRVNVGDAVFLINYIFKGGPKPICQ
jgi:Dockerin type I domain